MSPLFFVVAVILIALFAFYSGRSKALKSAGGEAITLHSLPDYYGGYVALWALIPIVIVFALWSAVEQNVIMGLTMAGLPSEMTNVSEAELGLLQADIINIMRGIELGSGNRALIEAADQYARLTTLSFGLKCLLALVAGIIGLVVTRQQIVSQFRARNQVEKVITALLILCSTIAILTTVGIILSLLFETTRFLGKVPLFEFLLGTQWSPQTALRADQVGASGAFGAIPLFAGTLLIAFIAMCVATPIGLFSAIYMAEYASSGVRSVLKPCLEVLAGIPTVVYGFFAVLTVAPAIRGWGESLGLDVASESALAAGLVMGIMIIPFVSSLSDDVITAVPQSLREGSYGLGATHSETIRRVVLPAALPGIVGGMLLAVSRAIGETMIVVMAAGLSANLTANPLDAVTTVTVQIVTLLVGDQEFDSAKTLAAFALGLVLFCITLCLNVVALHVVRKYREQYE